MALFGSDENGKYIITEQNAKLELKKMFDYYEIDIDEIENKEHRKAIQAGYDRLVKAVRLGRLKIKIENGITVTQKLRNDDEIIYREIDGKAKAEMDGKAAEAHNQKMHSLLGSLSGLGEGAIKQLKGVDLSLAEVLGLIFLSV